MGMVIESLKKQIASCETTLSDLRQQLAEAEHQCHEQEKVLHQEKSATDPLYHDLDDAPDRFRSEVCAIQDQSDQTNWQAVPNEQTRWPLRSQEYKRYGRQLIMPEIGLQGQLCLRNARVLIVGVGGLGCPAAAYLVGAGVGTVGLVDDDVVEESNLHRQILHSTARVGMAKVESAIVNLSSLNPSVKLVPHESRLAPEIAISIFQNYDLVLDCTDTPASRYLISDTCVLLAKPLVSASALRIDGQLMVLNNPPLPAGHPGGGPCYRCVFPKPPPPASVVSCGDGGILGPVVGTMGVLQALEAIKILARPPPSPSDSPSPAPQTSSDPPTLLIFSAYSTPMFRSIRLRSRKPTCAACSAQATISQDALTQGSMDYVQFCGSVESVDMLSPQERISAESYATLRSRGDPFMGALPSQDGHVLVDVRDTAQFEICSIPGSINVPFSEVAATPLREEQVETEWLARLRRTEKPIFVVCRLGNDSQIAVRRMKELGLDLGGKRFIGDIKGGLRAWRNSVDNGFPDY